MSTKRKSYAEEIPVLDKPVSTDKLAYEYQWEPTSSVAAKSPEEPSPAPRNFFRKVGG